MALNKGQPNRPGCLGTILNVLGIRDGSPAQPDIDVENLSTDSKVLPYRLRDDFLSPAEKSFYHILRTWAEDRYAVSTKVSLADLFFVVQPNENQGAYNRINRKHVDFVVCDASTVVPLFAIELDDNSHTRPDRVERDAFVDAVFEVASLPLLHVPARANYNTGELALIFNEALKQRGGAVAKYNEVVSEKSGIGETFKDQIPTCPKCGTRMVLRTAKTGEQAGKQFYGCPNYPRCRVILPIETHYLRHES